MAEPAERHWTIDAFLAWDDGSDRRYELVEGRIVAMVPPSLPDRDDTFYQFDLAVTCAPADPARRYVAEPELIVEVLSPSTALHDRGRKLDHHRQLPSVREIRLVASEERRVQHWRRDGPRWVVDDLLGDADLPLGIVAEPIPLAAIYEGSGV